jgi:hypothetical protein
MSKTTKNHSIVFTLLFTYFIMLHTLRASVCLREAWSQMSLFDFSAIKKRRASGLKRFPTNTSAELSAQPNKTQDEIPRDFSSFLLLHRLLDEWKRKKKKEEATRRGERSFEWYRMRKTTKTKQIVEHKNSL